MEGQKDILEVLRTTNNHSNQQHYAAAHAIPTLLSPVPINQMAPPRNDEAASWLSPAQNGSLPVSMQPNEGMILHHHSANTPHVGTAYDQRQDLPSTLDETSPSPMHVAGNPAALRWFGLLTNDAGREIVHAVENHADPSSSLLDNEASKNMSPLQRATSIVDSPQCTTTCASDPTSSEHDIHFPTRMPERQLWQSKEVIQLLPSERLVFENFVQHFSLWVRLPYSVVPFASTKLDRAVRLTLTD